MSAAPGGAGDRAAGEIRRPRASAPAARQRIDAAAHVGSKRATDPSRGSALAALDQRSSAKIRLPRPHDDALHAVTVNTAGGLTGDDRIAWSARAGAGSHLVLSSAACEKVYRSHGPDAVQSTRLHVERGARLDWLPQETIAYEGGRLARTLEADIDAGGTLTVCEAVTLGRGAMGERVRLGRLSDRWRVRREGRLVHAENLALGEDIEALHGDPAGLGRYRAFATVLACAPGSDADRERQVERVAAALARSGHGPGSRRGGDGIGAATALPGRVVFRALALDSRTLRAVLAGPLGVLCLDRPLPRVWHV